MSLSEKFFRDFFGIPENKPIEIRPPTFTRNDGPSPSGRITEAEEVAILKKKVDTLYKRINTLSSQVATLANIVQKYSKNEKEIRSK